MGPAFGGILRAKSVLISALFFWLSLPGISQSNYAVLSGSILDPQAHAVPAALVEVTSTETGASRRVSTNGQGLYEIPGLQPGNYDLRVTAPGFGTSAQPLQLEVAQHLAVDIRLQVEMRKDIVEVSGAPEAIHTNEAALGEVVEPESVANLPLNGRMLVDLVLTVPGAHVSHGAQTGNMNPLYWRPGQRSAVSVSGSRPNGNYFLLDGSTNTDPTFNTQNLSPSPDAVQEFKVQTGSYSAEMGGAGGGQINIVTRSGGTEFHGTVYEFLRNGFMDATSFESMGNNHMVQNNFGASLGGPLTHRHTFFFVNYEGFRHAMTDTMIDTVPTPQEIAGDFSQSGIKIFDPANGRAQFQSNGVLNVIPTNRINTAAETFLQKYVPQPNVMPGMTMPCGSATMGLPGVVAAGVDCNNYMDVRNELQTNNQGTARIDQILANGDSLTGRYSLSSEYGFTPGEMPPGGCWHAAAGIRLLQR